MKILNLEISPEVEAIMQNEKSDKNFDIVHIYGEQERTKILEPHKYEITITKNTSVDIYLHEFMHCVQYEMGFYKLGNYHTHTAVTKSMIGATVQNFVLDFYVNEYLHTKYKFKIHTTDKKYNYYKCVIRNINKNLISDNDLYNLLAVEIVYIYWNINQIQANELLHYSDELNDKIRRKFNQISGIITLYRVPTPKNSKLVFNRILQIVELSEIFLPVCPLEMWSKNQT